MPGRWLDRLFIPFTVLPTTVLMLWCSACRWCSRYPQLSGMVAGLGLFGGRFVGTGELQDLLTDPAFIGSFGITFGYTAVTVAAELVVRLGIALLLNIDLPWIAPLPHRADRADDDHARSSPRSAGSCCWIPTTASSTIGSAATSSGSAGPTRRCSRSAW